MFSVKVTGTDQVVALLKDLRGKRANAAIRKGTRAGCKRIVPRAKADIPVVERRTRSGEIQSGGMQRSVKVRAVKRNRSGWIGTVVSVGPENYQGDDFYAPMVEYGTKKMQARHYLKQAADQMEPTARAVAEQVILAELLK